PAAVGLRARFGRPVRLLPLGREAADDVLVRARGQGIGLDRGEEAGVVATAQALEDLGVLRRGFGGGGLHVGGHGAAWGIQLATCTAICRRVAGEGGGSGRSICARGTPRRASATTSLIRRQVERTPHWWAMPHWLLPAWLHSVIASGPSIASTISIRVMRSASRARR